MLVLVSTTWLLVSVVGGGPVLPDNLTIGSCFQDMVVGFHVVLVGPGFQDIVVVVVVCCCCCCCRRRCWSWTNLLVIVAGGGPVLQDSLTMGPGFQDMVVGFHVVLVGPGFQNIVVVVVVVVHEK